MAEKEETLSVGYTCTSCGHADTTDFNESEIQVGKGFCCPNCNAVLWACSNGTCIHYNKCAEEMLHKKESQKTKH
jgi:hypothetical protein